MYSVMKQPSLFRKLLFMCGVNCPDVRVYNETKTSLQILSDSAILKEVKDRYIQGKYAKNRMNPEVCYMDLVDNTVYTFYKKDLENLLLLGD